MEGAIPKTKTFSKPFIPQKGKDKNPPVKEGIGKERLDEETQNELRKKNLCFSYKEHWAPGHRCMGKGNVHYIEVHSDSDEEKEVAPKQGNDQGNSTEEKPQEEANEVAIATLSGTPRFHSFRVRGVLCGQGITTLIDGGATWIAKRRMASEDFEGFSVAVADGYSVMHEEDFQVGRDVGQLHLDR
jgi:hypothetical protein